MQELVDGRGALLIAGGKTDQDGRGSWRPLVPLTLAAVRRYLDAAGHADGALFRKSPRGGHRPDPLHANAIGEIVKRRAADAGLDGRTGHSMRVGTAQFLAEHGASLVEMQQAGGWSSPAMPAQYAGAQLAGKGAGARLLRRGGE